MLANVLAVALVLASSAAAVPNPNALTPLPTPTSPLERRDLQSAFSSVTGKIADALPTVLGAWPSLDDIKKKLDIKDDDLKNISQSALIIPSYANYTQQGWNVRFYGLIYKQPNVNASELADIIDDFKTNNLNDTERSLLNNRTSALAALPVANANVTALIYVNNTLFTNSSGLTLQTADNFGEVDQFITVPNLAKNSTKVQVVGTAINNATGPGNSSVILVPTSGYSVVSDIDDVLRITKVYIPNKGLYNSFVEPYVNVPGIPELFNHWLKTLPGVAFHYDTTTPVQLTRTYVDYLFGNFPVGSLEMRPINISEPSQILDARQNSLLKLFQTFPERKFVLVGDTSSSTLLSAYPQIAQQFPSQIGCIFIRNTSATDPDDKIPYSTKEFQNVDQNRYFFYRTTEDLANLDVAGGKCRNESIPQNVTFGEQGGFLDGHSAGVKVASPTGTLGVAMLVALLGLVAW